MYWGPGVLGGLVYASVVLEGMAVLGGSIGICGAFGVAGAVLEGKSNEEIARWGYWGTTAGVVIGVPLTICACVLMDRS